MSLCCDITFVWLLCLVGRFPLWLAADNKDISIVQILLDGRADVNKVEPQEKTTALHRAVINKTWPVCVLLVKHGADIDLPDVKGMTALDYVNEFYPEMAEQMEGLNSETATDETLYYC